jgi:hypothetical protein
MALAEGEFRQTGFANSEPDFHKNKGPGRSRPGPCRIGGAKRDRTADLYNAIVALSQLSYGPEFLRGRPLGRPPLPSGANL